MPKPKKRGTWYQTLFDAKTSNAIADFETFDGAYRRGRVTGLITRKLILDGDTVEMVTGFQLNDDKSDVIDLVNLKAISFRGVVKEP